MKISGLVAAAVFITVMAGARTAQAQTKLDPQERLCDPSFQDCRSDLLKYIDQENVGIDVGFWLMSDTRYASHIIARFNAGVPVRVLMDPRCLSNHDQCDLGIDALQQAHIPMRNRITSGILHWKMILLAGQQQLEFAGANFTGFEMTPVQPYVNYTDEVVYYTNDLAVVHSFMTKFDDLWTSTTEFANYSDVTGPLLRNYPTYSIDPELNFPPHATSDPAGYRKRAVALYQKEMQAIDVQMFRITDRSHSDAIIAAVNRGVPVRLITDETEYRNPDRLWDAFNVDMMYHAGVKVKLDAHQGIDHEKAVILYGQATSIIGSSNWTTPSTNSQREHNYFTVKPSVFNWLKDQFNRKWNNSNPAGATETKDFVPLPPGAPKIVSPANGATAVPTTGQSLTWDGGPWGQIYDIYYGTNPNQLTVVATQQLGPTESANDFQKYALPTLQPGTKYYWKIVSKTMALVQQTNTPPVWSFTTAGTSGGGGTVPAPWSDGDVGDVGIAGSASFTTPTFTVNGAGADVWGTADALNFVYQPLSGDGSIVARVASVQNVNAWTKAGVMIRGSLSAGSAQAFMLVSSGKGVAYQRRLSDGATSVSSTGSASVAPRWVKLTRSGNTIAAFESATGAANSWTQVGSSTFTMPASVLIGLGVSSHVRGVNATATFDNVIVTTGSGQTASLPEGWDHRDIGAVNATGNATFNSPVFTLSARGADIWGTADQFHYAYTALTGDATVIVRVPSVSAANAWSKAGIMVRETLDANAKHATILVSAGKGVAFQRRPTTGGASVSTAGSTSAPPRWLQLVRNGDTFTASESPDGSTWTTVGTTTIPMASAVFVGLAATSHTTTATTTATFDNVSINNVSVE